MSALCTAHKQSPPRCNSGRASLDTAKKMCLAVCVDDNLLLAVAVSSLALCVECIRESGLQSGRSEAVGQVSRCPGVQVSRFEVERTHDADSLKFVFAEDAWAWSEALTDPDLDHLVAHFSHAPGLYFFLSPCTHDSHVMPLARAPVFGAVLQAAQKCHRPCTTRMR